MWAYAREGSAKEQMRLCYENVKAGNVTSDNSQLIERFSEQTMYEKFVEHIYKQSEEMDNWMKILEEEITEYE